MRFLRSVALPKAAKLRLAAIRSAVAMPAPISSGSAPAASGRALGFGLQLALGLGLLRHQSDGAARLLHRLGRALGGAHDRNLDRGLELAVAEQADPVAGVADDARSDERLGAHRLARVELARFDEGLDLADVHRRIFRFEDVDESALGKAAEERHLPALEAVEAHARARLLALLAAARLLALARAQAAAETRALDVRAGIVADFVELHDLNAFRARPAYL